MPIPFASHNPSFSPLTPLARSQARSRACGRENELAYDLCRSIMASHGHTYALATQLLSPAQQRAVWTLYAWARIVDDHVDCPAATDCADNRIEQRVRQLSAHFSAAVKWASDVRGKAITASTSGESLSETGNRDLAVLTAAAQTFSDFGIDPNLSQAFINSMLMDVPSSSTHVAQFTSWDQLDDYMWGSAEVIGLEMLPILGTRPGITRQEAEPYAKALGRAFQVTNFVRDTAEDYRRGRIYLPLNQWEAFGVSPDEIGFCVAHRRVTPPVRRALAYFIAYNRAIYAEAHPGVAMLDSPGRHAIRAAEILYSGILSEIEKADYNVFARRARVGRFSRAAVALPLLLTAAGARLRREIVG